MAENLRWILSRHSPDAKAVLWAHNLHVASEDGMLGSYVKRTLGDAYRSIGFVFNRGRFRAFDTRVGRQSDVSVGPNPLGSVFAAAGLKRALVDLRQLPAAGPVFEWFRTPQATRLNGGVYPDEGLEAHLGVMPDRHDALVFVEETDAARLRHPDAPTPLDTPTNLGFDSGRLGAAPPHWEMNLKSAVRVVTRERCTDSGGRCAFIERPVNHLGPPLGGLRQRIRASDWRGGRVTVRAKLRTAVYGWSNQVHFYLRVRGGDSPQVEYRTVSAGDWAPYEIAAPVSETAEVIEYGVALVGEGSVWFDDVSVE